MNVTGSAQVENVLVADFRVPEGAEAQVRVEDGRTVVATVAASVTGRTASAAVMGLKPDRKYRLVGVANGKDRADAVVHAPPAPDALEFSVPDADDDLRGLVLLSIAGPWSGVVVVDREGDPVWWVESDPGWTSAAPRPTRDGKGLLWITNDVGRELDDQRLVRVEVDGSRRTEGVALKGHHMVEELDDGTFAWPAWDVRSVPWDHGALAPVLGDALLVGDGQSPPTTRFSFFDDRGPAYVPCAHGLEQDERLGQTVFEWTHTNAAVWVPERDAIVIVARMIDSALGIDRATGEVRWQLGGRDTTLAYEQQDDTFSHGHLSDAWDGGLLLFDNGGHLRDTSRVVEYTLDLDEGAARVVWEHEDPEGRRYTYEGDARRLPSGNVLVAWSTGARIDEVTRSHRLVWRLQGPDDATIGRIRFLDSLGELGPDAP